MEPTPTATPIPTLVTPPPPVTSPVIASPPPQPKSYLPWIVGGAIVVLLLIILISINIGLALIKSAFQYTPPPAAPAPAPAVTIKPVSSKYATDAGVLKLRDNLKTIGQSIDSVDLMEPQIAPPALDLNINIKNAQ